MILLFRKSRLSFCLFNSVSWLTTVLLQASRAVGRNSFSGSSILTLEPLCLMELLGNFMFEFFLGMGNAVELELLGFDSEEEELGSFEFQ